MAIRGDLLSVDLSNVFQMLSMNRKRGVLRIENREDILLERSLVVEDEGIGLVALPDVRDLWALLVDAGHLTYEDFRDADEKARRYGLSRDQLLRERGLVDEGRLREAARRAQEELLLEIFLWREVSFSLDEEEQPAANPQREMFTVDLIIMEAARRQDEWLRAAELLGGAGDVWKRRPMPSFATLPAEDDLKPIEKIVLDHLDGVRATDQIMQATALPRYHVDLAICRLMEDKLVLRVGPGELVETATRLLGASRPQDAIRLLELAQKSEPDGIEIHLRLAEAHLERSEVSKAAEHYKHCAEALIDHGRAREAVDVLRDVVRLIPTDFSTLRRALELIVVEGVAVVEEDAELFDQGVKLFGFLQESSQYDDAQHLLDLLIELAPDDVPLAVQRGRLLARRGYVEDAAQVYMKVANRLFGAGDLEAAAGLYRTVSGFELFDARIKALCRNRLDQIQDAQRRRRKRRAAGIGMVVSTLVTAALGFGYFLYENHASLRLQALREGQKRAETFEDWQRIADDYDAFVSSHPLSFAAAGAKELRDDALEVLADMDKRRAEEARRLAAERDALMERARTVYRDALVRQGRRDLRGAAEGLRATIALAEQATRTGWLRTGERDVAARLAALEGHIAREDEILAEAERLRGENRLAEAHGLVRGLLDEARSDDLRDPVRVIDAATAAALTLPVRVTAVPAGARIVDEDGEVRVGTFDLDLTAARPRRTLTVTREGHRDAEVVLDRETAPFETAVLLEEMPLVTWHVEARFAHLLDAGGRLAGVERNGSVRVYDGPTSRASWTYRPDRLVTVTCPPLAADALVVIGASDGRTVGLDVVTRRPRFVHRETQGVPCALAVHGETVLIGVSGIENVLVALDARNGRVTARRRLPSAPAAMTVRAGTVLVVTDDGVLWRGTGPDDLKPVAEERRFEGVLRPAAAGVVLVERGLAPVVLPDGPDAVLPEPRAMPGELAWGPVVVGRRLAAGLADGRVLVLDEEGRVSEWTAPRLHPGAPVAALDEDRVLLPLADGGCAAHDVATGRPSALMRRGDAVVADVLVVRGRCHVVFDDEGDIEIYDASR